MGWMDGESATKTGLGNAYEMMQTAKSSMPEYQSSASLKPATQDYYSYSATTPMSSISSPNYQLNAGNAPEYKGMMAGDYDTLQKALYAPAQQAAQNAYDQGYNRLNNAMGGQGLYGSSMMAQQANQGLDRTYQNALATAANQAAAQRYGMQQQDLASQNQFAKDLYTQALAREQNMNVFAQRNAAQEMQQAGNIWESQLKNNYALNDYAAKKQAYELSQAQNQINWQNQQDYERYQYELQKANFNNALRNQGINEQLALSQAGRGAWNGQLDAAQIANRKDAYNTANQNAMIAGGIGMLDKYGSQLGGLLSGIGSGIGNLFSSDTYYNPEYVAPEFNDYTDWEGWGA